MKFKAGDKVIILDDSGWKYWTSSMYTTVGKIGTVKGSDSSLGNYFTFEVVFENRRSFYYRPAFLRKVNEKKSKQLRWPDGTFKGNLIKKAKQSKCRFKVCAMAFNKKGEYLGMSTNKQFLDKAGGSKHAEREVIARYGNNVKQIILCRVNSRGNILPIDPCHVCKKVIDKLGIKIKRLEE